jgi:lipopolysaccharide biosynthesis protein
MSNGRFLANAADRKSKPLIDESIIADSRWLKAKGRYNTPTRGAPRNEKITAKYAKTREKRQDYSFSRLSCFSRFSSSIAHCGFGLSIAVENRYN